MTQWEAMMTQEKTAENWNENQSRTETPLLHQLIRATAIFGGFPIDIRGEPKETDPEVYFQGGKIRLYAPRRNWSA